MLKVVPWVLLAATLCCATPRQMSKAESKLEPSLRSAVKNPAAPYAFPVEKGADGRTIVPVFVQTKDTAATAAAIRRAGGSTSTMTGDRIVARLPLDTIMTVAERPEVVRIEPSSRATWKSQR